MTRVVEKYEHGATVYRRWPSRAEPTDDVVPVISESGSVRDELFATLRSRKAKTP